MEYGYEWTHPYGTPVISQQVYPGGSTTISAVDSVNTAHSGEYTWTFTPSTNLFTPKQGTLSLTVNKIDPIMDAAESIELELDDSMLNDMKTAIDAKIENVENADFTYTAENGEVVTDNILKSKNEGASFYVTVNFAGNDTYKPASKTTQVVVKKPLNVTNVEKEYVYAAGSRGEVAINLGNQIPSDAKNVVYTLAENTAGYIAAESIDGAGLLTYSVAKDSGEVGDETTLVATVSSDNYMTKDISVNINLSIAIKR